MKSLQVSSGYLELAGVGHGRALPEQVGHRPIGSLVGSVE